MSRAIIETIENVIEEEEHLLSLYIDKESETFRKDFQLKSRHVMRKKKRKRRKKKAKKSLLPPMRIIKRSQEEFPKQKQADHSWKSIKKKIFILLNFFFPGADAVGVLQESGQPPCVPSGQWGPNAGAWRATRLFSLLRYWWGT